MLNIRTPQLFKKKMVTLELILVFMAWTAVNVAIIIKAGVSKQTIMLALSLPECLMEFCKMTLTFESMDEILWCDHSNESSLPVLSHDAICLSKFWKMKFANLVEICLWPHLAVKGLTRLVSSVLIFMTRWKCHFQVASILCSPLLLCFDSCHLSS